jgi:thymidylate synthase
LIDNGVTFWSDWPYKEYHSKKLSKYIENDLVDSKTIKKFNVLSQKEFENKIKKDDNFALKWGDLGPVYGKQWVDWGGHYEKVEVKKEYNYTKSETKIVNHLGWKDVYFPGINQIDELIYNLQTDPDSRRHIVSAWNVNDIDDMMLPPCHIMFQCYTRTLTHEERYEYYFRDKMGYSEFLENYNRVEQIHKLNDFKAPMKELSLQLYQRSVDVGLGLPFNIASYSLLLYMLSSVVNMKPGEFVWQGGDIHIYNNHEEQLLDLLKRESYEPCILKLNKKDSIYDFRIEDVQFVNYNSHPNIKMEVAV